MLPAA
jgi:hypothetical protein